MLCICPNLYIWKPRVIMWKKTAKVQEPDNYGKAYDYAVFLLSLRLRTAGEIRHKMAGRGYASAVIEKILEQLRQQRYIDDLRYAEIFLDNLKAYKNFGFYGIKKKLLGKRLPVELVEQVLAEGLSAAEERAIAKRLLKKEVADIGYMESDGDNISYNTFSEEATKQKQKLAQKLKARGFRGDVIAKLLF